MLAFYCPVKMYHNYLVVFMDQESRPSWSVVCVLGSHQAAAEELAGAAVFPTAQSPLLSSPGCWQNSIPCGCWTEVLGNSSPPTAPGHTVLSRGTLTTHSLLF